MRKTIHAVVAAAALAMMAGCGGGNPNEPTAEENRELNNAAAMLDEQDASADSLTVQDPALGNGDAPAPAATGEVPVSDEAQGSEGDNDLVGPINSH
jgi:predicted small lipoprotein YifL